MTDRVILRGMAPCRALNTRPDSAFVPIYTNSGFLRHRTAGVDVERSYGGRRGCGTNMARFASDVAAFCRSRDVSAFLGPRRSEAKRGPHLHGAGEGLGPASNRRRNSLPGESTMVELVCAKDWR